MTEEECQRMKAALQELLMRLKAVETRLDQLEEYRCKQEFLGPFR